MALRKIDIKALDSILETMIDTVEKSKFEIFQIGEQCRQEHVLLAAELKEVKEQVKVVIEEGDSLEGKSRLARQRLAAMSERFRDFTEEEVRIAYEGAQDLHVKFTVSRELEKQLRKRRDELERRLISLLETIERAESLVSQVTVVSNYLSSDIREIGEVLENAKMKQALGFRIIEAQEEERKRLSRDIHDGPAQLLANVLIRSDLAERVYREKGPDLAFAEVRNLKELVRAALSEVRNIIYDLRPMALDDLGLIPTLKKYLAAIEERDHVTKIDFLSMGKEQRLPAKYEVALFRLIQESVQNALKHAEASEINVRIESLQDRVSVIVKDNGVGFDVEENKSGSFGILGMKERVDILEGRITIDSKPGAGTIIAIRIPISE